MVERAKCEDHFPRGLIVGTTSDLAGNVLVSEDFGSPWRSCREWIKFLSRGRISPPKWMNYQPKDFRCWVVFLVDAKANVARERRALPSHTSLTPSGAYIVCMLKPSQNSSGGPTTLSVWPSRVPPRRWSWGVLALVVIAIVAVCWRRFAVSHGNLEIPPEVKE